LTTSKAQQFCETSSIFEPDNVKNEAILRDFLIFQSWQLTTSKTKQFCETSFKNGKLSAELHGLVPMRFVIFPLHLSKVLRLHEKVMPGHMKCCTCHAKSSEQT